MKNIKNFKLFIESLSDDFKSTIKSYNANPDKYNIGYQADQFAKALPKSNKQEFMYRVSDGEDILSIIEDMVDKCDLSDEDQFKFRVLVMDNKLEKLKSEYNMQALQVAFQAIIGTIEMGFDDSVEDLKKHIEEGENVEPEQIITILEDAVEYLTKAQVLANWAYERPMWNPNEEKIEVGNRLIDFLKGYFI